MSPRRLPLFRPSSLLALLALWLILIVGSCAGRSGTPETGLIRLVGEDGRISGSWAIPRAVLQRRFGRAWKDQLPMVSSQLAQELGLAADGEVCRVRITPDRLEKDIARFKLDTGCPADAERLDAHVAPQPGPSTGYRTLVSWTRGDLTRHALATADATCVAFEPVATAAGGQTQLAATYPQPRPHARSTSDRVHSER